MAACRLVQDAERYALMRSLLIVDGGEFAKDIDDTGRTPLFFASTHTGLHALLAAKATDVNAKDAAGHDAVASRIVGSVPLPAMATQVPDRILVKGQVRQRMRSQ